MKREFSSTPKENQPSSSSCIDKRRQEGKIRLAVVSGFFSTVGSLFGKFAGGAQADSIVSQVPYNCSLYVFVQS